MNNLKKILVVVVMLLFPADAILAQQAFTYTQYMNNLTPYNSAYALLKGGGSINFSGRKQWVGINGAPSSLVINGDVSLEKIKANAGLIVLNDKVAVENLSDVNLYFAKSVQLSDNQFLAASVNGGIRHYTANYSKLNAYDPKFSDDMRETTPTIGFGILLYNPDLYYIGLSMPRLSFRSLGKASLDNNYFHDTWYFSGAYLHRITDDIKIKPVMLISYTKTLPVLFDISATGYIKDQLGIGINYRNTKEMAWILSYLFKNKLNVSYSYQTNLGAASSGSIRGTTHEIGIGLRFGIFEGQVL